jgi:hypothetical protein
VWLDEGGGIDAISRTLGDNHSTVRRLVNGWFVLMQAKAEGFDLDQATKKSFAFSHLYTALARPSVREFLGISDENLSDSPRENPVPPDKIEELLEFMSWLYGQEQRNEPTLILSQNPNLNQLSRVLGNVEATQMLRANRDLQLAFERVEPPSIRFDAAVMKTAQHSEEAMKHSGHYQGDPTILRVVEGIDRNVRNLLLVMRQTVGDEKN